VKTFITNLLNAEPLLFIKGGLIFLLGPLNLQLAYLLLAVGIDLIFGIQVARKEQQFKWSLLFTKVRHKVYIYAMWISMFHAFDMVAGLPDTARWAVVVMLVGTELISAAKNTAKLGHNKLSNLLESVYLSLMKSQPSLENLTTAEEEANKASEETSQEGGKPNETENKASDTAK
jgi:phage-related holin